MPPKIHVPFLNFGQKKGESRTFQPIFHPSMTSTQKAQPPVRSESEDGADMQNEASILKRLIYPD